MIDSIENFFTKEQCDYFINCFKNNLDTKFEVKDSIYSFKAVNVITSSIDYKKIAPILDAAYFKDRLRIQLINSGYEVNTNFHTHANDNVNSFVIFLNDDYTGGELEFQTGEIFKPEIGTLVKFQTFNAHRVNQVSKGDRYTLVGLLDKSDTNTTLGFRIVNSLV